MRGIMRKLICAILSIEILFGVSSIYVDASTLIIKDVQASSQNYDKITESISQGWMSLTLGKFYPSKTVTRAEFAAILAKLTGDIKIIKTPSKSSFKDVSTKDQFFKYIEAEKSNMSYFKTKGGNYFKPKTFVTREDALATIVKVLGYDSDEAASDGADSEIDLDDILDDASKISPGLKSNIAIGVKNELIDLQTIEDKTYLNPKKAITREQLAVMLVDANDKKDYTKEEDLVIDQNTNDQPQKVEPTVTSLKINLNKTSLYVGDSAKATVTEKMNTETASALSVKYTSSNIAVATVDANGTVLAVKAGNTDIVATVGDKTDKVAITVADKQSQITNININKGTPGNTYSNLKNQGMFAEQGDWIYYSIGEGFYRMKLDGTDKTKMNDDYAMYINIVGDFVYYFDKGKIYRMKTDGTDKHILSEYADGMGLNVVGDYAYYTNKGALYRIKTDGSENGFISKDKYGRVVSGCGLTVSGDWIYYNNSNDNYYLYKIKIDGSQNIKVKEKCHGIVFEGDYCYYVGEDGKNIYRFKTEDPENQELANSCISDNAKYDYYNIYGGKLYYVDPHSGKIYKMDLDGSNKTCVNNLAESFIFTNDSSEVGPCGEPPHLVDPWPIFIVGEKIYYYDSNKASKISYIYIDGSDAPEELR